MSNRDVSIVFKASDRLSESVKSMQQNVRGLSRDVSEYRKVQDTAFKEKAKISFDITQAKKELKELEKAVKQNAAGSKEAFTEKRLELERLNEEYRRLSDVAKEAGKAERQLSADISRSNNANAGRGTGLGGLAQGLATAGLGKMFSGAATTYLNTTLTSVFGSTTGNMISGIGGSAISGAAMGSIAGPVGAAVGAAVGGLTGAINALAEKDERLDDAFRGEVKDLYTTAVNDTSSELSRGSAAAALREGIKINYKTLLGDDALGKQLYETVKQFGDTTPYNTTTMLNEGMKMLQNGISSELVPELMRQIGDIAMGDSEKFSGLSYAIAQSGGLGYLTGQDKNQMTGWGFNPLRAIAENQGLSIEEATKMMSNRQLTSDMLFDAIKASTEEGGQFYDAINAAGDSFNVLTGMLDSAKSNIEIAMGEGYNETRKKGMTSEYLEYNGEMGEKMKEAYNMIGQYEAELENQHQQKIIDAIKKANEDIEKLGLEGVDAEKRVWEAKAQAEIDWKNTEEYQMKLNAEKGLVESIQNDVALKGQYVAFGEEMANAFSKGWKSVVQTTLADTGSHLNGTWLTGGSTGATTGKGGRGRRGNGNATGLPRVPYDGFPAILHEGEQVLTRQEANQRSGAGVQIAKIADSIVVREDADIDKIARALVQRLSVAAERYA